MYSYILFNFRICIVYVIYAITIYDIQYTKIYDSNIHDYSSIHRICQNQIFILFLILLYQFTNHFFTFHSKQSKMRKTNFAFGGIRTHDFLNQRKASLFGRGTFWKSIAFKNASLLFLAILAHIKDTTARSYRDLFNPSCTRAIRKVMRLNSYLLHFKSNLIKNFP